ncbi:MAG: hypothetical protein DLM53_01395 [Candidatus Eremiobacter antarcticus]|nr:hypothetical protein [Candidatus Eremiobacteraeota bacterium]PZR63463.1 MAG: hypothetical protein DLM53_01395 [Candidatus Eremiobacter sp. RRmetagenome_bin22]
MTMPGGARAAQRPRFELAAQQRWMLGAIVAAAFAVRLVEALRRAIHTDERISLEWAANSGDQIIEILRAYDAHPPLFFLFLHVFGLAQAPEWLPRIVMVAFGTASVALLFAVVRLWVTPQAALVAALCAAFMPSLIFYDTWIRMYVVSDFFALLAFFALSVLLTTDDLSARRRRFWWGAWTLCTAVGPYLLYIGWFFTAAQVLYVLTLRRHAAVRALTGASAAALMWLPQLPTFLRQTHVGGLNFASYQHHELRALALLPGQATFVPELEGYVAALGAMLAWLGIIFSLWCTLKIAPRSILPWLGAPAVLLLLYSAASNKWIYLDRYYLMLAYGVAAWAGCVFQWALNANKRPVLGALAVVLTTLLVLGTLYGVDSAFYTADWPGVQSLLLSGSQPRDLFVLEQGMSRWALMRNPTIKRHPYILVWFRPDVENSWRLLKPYRRVWLVAYQPRGVDPQLDLLSHLQHDYHLSLFHEFQKVMPAESVSVGLFVR